MQILSHIASSFISEYENVANSSIAYLLNMYPAARRALKTLLDIEELPTRYITELATDKNGRPDVTGLDENGNKLVIIEGKFWANLTPNQPGSYLNEISDQGKILFLAPRSRVESLKIDIVKRLGGDDERVMVSSWDNFLSLVERENGKEYNHRLDADLVQISSLCRRMDTEGMPPLSASDLDPMVGRVVSQFADVIDECNALLRKWRHTDFTGLKTTPQKYGHGFYFRGYNFGCWLGFDSQKWYQRGSHTPIWLNIKKITPDREWVESERIAQALNRFDSANAYESDYGIVLRTGLDRVQLVNHIVGSVKSVLEYLDRTLNENPD